MKYIEKLHIEGLKRFREIDIIFNKNMNVIVGENAGSKATKARELGITILNEKDLIDILNGDKNV